MQASSREAPETEPSAITSGRDKRVHARLRRAMELADGEAHLLHPAPDRSHKSRGGTPRGELPAFADRASLPAWGARRLASACGTASSARERCFASTRAPAGAPLPSCVERETGKPRRSSCLASTTKLARKTHACTGSAPPPATRPVRRPAARCPRCADTPLRATAPASHGCARGGDTTSSAPARLRGR
jgi:hypothetical protein